MSTTNLNVKTCSHGFSHGFYLCDGYLYIKTLKEVAHSDLPTGDRERNDAIEAIRLELQNAL